MNSRTVDQFAYNGLSTGEFAERISVSAEQVRELIAGGWFKVMKDGTPECIDIRAPGKKQPTYRIHPRAVDRFFRERAT